MILDQDLDRLADGELSPAERRELLRELESSPGAWRRCALAFVEAQTIRQELLALRDEASPAPASVKPIGRAQPASGGWFALAASVLIAFVAGAVSTQTMAPEGKGPVASTDPIDQPMLPGPGEVEFAIAQNHQRAERQHHADPQQIAPQRTVLPDSNIVTFWAKDEHGERRSLRTRLVDADQLDERLGVRFRSAIPPEVRQQYEQQGYRLESRQRYAPLNMDNGRVLVVPVEDMHIAPAPQGYL